jgi:hypothetical protein
VVAEAVGMEAVGVAALGEGQSGREEGVIIPQLAPDLHPLPVGSPTTVTCSELQPLLRLPPGLRPSSPEGTESTAGGIG